MRRLNRIIKCFTGKKQMTSLEVREQIVIGQMLRHLKEDPELFTYKNPMGDIHVDTIYGVGELDGIVIDLKKKWIRGKMMVFDHVDKIRLKKGHIKQIRLLGSDIIQRDMLGIYSFLSRK
jgi:hypothetical protein